MNDSSSPVGLARRTGRVLWRVRGRDALDFLHRMLTQDLRGLPVGHGTRACLLDRRGRVLADFRVWRFADFVLLDGEAACAPAREVLERMTIADDVEIEDVSGEHARLVLVGEGLDAWLGRHAGEDLVPDGVGPIATTGEASAQLVRFGVETALEVLAEPAAGEAFSARHLGSGEVVALDEASFDDLRIAAGEPRYGLELDDERLFNEARLGDAVSWTKGCYPGQEVVAKARYVGRAPHGLARLVAAPGQAVEAGEALREGERKAGWVASAASGARAGQGGPVLAWIAGDLPTVPLEAAGGARLDAVGWGGTLAP